MGNCSSTPSIVSHRSVGDGGGSDDNEAALLSGTLVWELGIKSLLLRPDGRQLRILWRSLGESKCSGDNHGDGEMTLGRQQCCDFFREVSRRFGDGSWRDPRGLRDERSPPDSAFVAVEVNASTVDSTSIAKNPHDRPVDRPIRMRRRSIGLSPALSSVFSRPVPTPVSAQLLRSETVSWEDVRSKIWDEPRIKNVSPATTLSLQEQYLQKLGKRLETIAGDDNNSPKSGGHIEAVEIERMQTLAEKLTRKQAKELALEVLSTNEMVPSKVKERAVISLTSKQISFLVFLRRIGPIYEKFRQVSFKEGLGDNSRGDLDLDFSEIKSFSPPRSGTPCEILNCGQAVMTAMLNAVKAAESEIMMSWWEFCPTIPAIRGRDLGKNAWDDDAEMGQERTLPSLLKRKAEEGVMIYIVINDVTLNWTLVDYAIKSLSSAHDNITVMRHPDWRILAHTHHQKFVVVDRAVAVLGGVDWTVARWDLPSHPIFDSDSSVHPGLELPVNGKRYKSDISEYWTQPSVDLTSERGEQECSMWQDVAICVRGDAANDVAVNFMQRWAHALKNDFRIEPYGFSGRPSSEMPAIPAELDGLKHCYALNFNSAYSPYPLADGGFPSPGTSTMCQCQIVRSAGSWSCGIDSAETSHYEAWISAINGAESYIYIEQQYFVCSMGVKKAKNRIAEAILRRVERAVERSEPFRIYVVIPATVFMTVVNYFTRRTLLQDGRGLKRRERSLRTRIQMLLNKASPGSYWDGRSADAMLSVCFLSSVGKSESGRWEVGEIFVHSKVLVVDDRVAVVGSANVNDRSFVGTSDSEIGAILWDEEVGKDGGKTGCVKDFRLRLWRQYLGLPLDGGSTDDAVAHPASEEAFALWRDTASKNQGILSSVFGHFPSDDITSYKKYVKMQSAYKAKTPAERAASLKDLSKLKDVRGLLTKYPPKFLGDAKKRSYAHLLMTELPLSAYL